MAEHGSWFREYCEKTTSHCMRYFMMKHRSLVEKFYWILIYLLMTLISVSIMQYVLHTWLHNPTVMFIENMESAIQDIPFPSITLCSSDQYRKTVWNNYEKTKYLDWKNLQQYQAIQCSANIYGIKSELRRTEYFDFDEFKYLINACAVSCPELIPSDVRWQNNTLHDFCQFVQPMITMFGLCYTINMIPVYQLLHDEYLRKYLDIFPNSTYFESLGESFWNLDDGYSYYSEDYRLEEVIPARTSGVSYYHRLRLNLHTFDSEFSMCPNTNYASGFIFITLANPSEYSSVATRAVIQSDTYSKIQITPRVQTIDSDLKWRSPEVRKCYLHNERKLMIFKHYTELNCMTECSINLTISMCNCVTMDTVVLAAADVKICGLLKRDCVSKILQRVPTIMQTKCRCLPTCTTIDYEISVTSNDENWDYLKTTRLLKNDSRGASLELVFRTPYFTANRLASILNLDSLISVVGGILSLFLGINLINIFEILYVIIKMTVSCTERMFNKN